MWLLNEGKIEKCSFDQKVTRAFHVLTSHCLLLMSAQKYKNSTADNINLFRMKLQKNIPPDNEKTTWTQTPIATNFSKSLAPMG